MSLWICRDCKNLTGFDASMRCQCGGVLEFGLFAPIRRALKRAYVLARLAPAAAPGTQTWQPNAEQAHFSVEREESMRYSAEIIESLRHALAAVQQEMRELTAERDAMATVIADKCNEQDFLESLRARYDAIQQAKAKVLG